MVDIRMRPRFIVPVREIDAVLDQLEKRVTVKLDQFDLTRFRDGHAVLQLKDSHMWSPQVLIDAGFTAEGKPELRCRFEPQSSVWSTFMAAYAVAIFGGIISFSWGVGQWMAGDPPHVLWVTIICLLIGTNAYTFSLFGRALGFEDMYKLRAEVDAAIDDSTNS